MIPLTQRDIDELRLAADKAKRDGHFEAGQRLEALLDAHEDAKEHEHRADDAERKAQELTDALEECRKSAEKAESKTDPDDMDGDALREEVRKLRSALEDVLAAADGALP